MMSQLETGLWQPWELDGSGRHQCKSGFAPSTDLPRLATNPETFLTRCFQCRQQVYYHTNGYGDRVYFDQLGYPWQVHSCWQDYCRRANHDDRLDQFPADHDRPTIERMILQGAIRKVPASAQISIGVYRVAESAVAKQMGLSVQELRQRYGHLYVMTQPFELRMISDSSAPELPDTEQPRIVKVVPKSTPRPRKQPILPKVQCPNCGKFVYQFRFDEHIHKHEMRRFQLSFPGSKHHTKKKKKSKTSIQVR